MSFLKNIRAKQSAYFQAMYDEAQPNEDMAMTRFVKWVLGVK